ncbi:MAG: NAD-dependent protein deacylase [Acutalibacteraceae bacterium]
MENIQKLKNIIDESQNICVFTGAGISCPSGIPDFRSADGLYNREMGYQYSPEEIISHSFFVSHTQMFYDFYKSAILYPEAKPNEAHKFFASLEEKGKNVTVVTQNIDGLHQAAGSSRVIELHGSVHRNYCTKCGKFFPLSYIAESNGIPTCDADGAVIKPDVVLYEEPLNSDAVFDAVNAIEQADTMFVVGTSLVVYPAASYIRYFKGKHLILINKSATQYDRIAELSFNDDVINVVKEIQSIKD